ncbi:hypothetical protein CAI21_18955 [Alkalilimnicola ehrlichii]|uniref:NAD(P)-binding domain-containing protein n=1 Tax=Alkalilimnicola ehrlichii TaxID=351052 RepID=A0A3E0WJJ6_9GAMM|nr:NAD(P)H-binding protein [Alkalilimnicola ehrlichii]RFA25517.1 hypothetical protein CAI21_18955 [Alkalilimnicola ehrlichii]RFA32629.1 hypothetical protein CAL65_19360 [Alkalilimnicola ehrlichii]
MIGITGASGKLGKATIHHLLRRVPPESVVAIVRDPGRLGALAESGIHVRVADYDDKASLAKALPSVKTLLQISATAPGEEGMLQEQAVVEAAVSNGVRRILYTSSLLARPDARFMGTCQAAHTEAAIIKSGLEYTFFRNSLYLELIPELAGDADRTGVLQYPAGDGKVSFVSRQDIAEAMAICLLQPISGRRVLEITGSQAVGFAEVAAAMSSNRGVVFADMDSNAYRAMIAERWIPDAVIDFLVSMAEAVRAGEFALVDGTLESLLGRPLVSLDDYLRMA